MGLNVAQGILFGVNIKGFARPPILVAAKRGNMEETSFINLIANEKISRVTEALEEMGISLKDEDGNFLCIYDLLRVLSDKFQELDPEQNLCYNKKKERERKL